MSAWNPDLYLQFKEERTQPARDLAARIALSNPQSVIDLGCGPGNSTQVLWKSWPNAEIIGMDSSVEMIEKARAAYPDRRWLHADIRTWNPPDTFDIVFSNATLQWVPDHSELIPRLFAHVRPGGVLAVQLPANQEAPLHLALLRISRREEWREQTTGCEKMLIYHKPDFYYGILSPLSGRIHLWTATYYRVLQSAQDLIDWYSSTGMRIYLERLPAEAQKEGFRAQVREACRVSYPPQRDGRILYPFRRLFLIAHPA